MNADTTDTRYPHLDLGELIAGVAGQPVDDRAREHLAGCAQCQLEAKRWNLVADGVRGLTAAAPEPVRPAWPRPTRQRGLAPVRRVLLVAGSAAAALVVLLGVGSLIGVVHVHLSGPGTGPVLTAVTGCTQLEQAEGTLERVNGDNLVIQTASGRSVTVTTTPSTFVSMSGPLRSDITDGASVMVRGNTAEGTIQAAIITVGQPFSAVNPPGFVPAQGTVSNASTAGFTLVTPTGTRVVVSTSSDTLVVVPHASPDQLKTGSTIYALGSVGLDGSLSARAVAAVTQLQAGGHLSEHVSVKDCSPSSIVEALGRISAATSAAG
jgi:hypothetical protein